MLKCASMPVMHKVHLIENTDRGFSCTVCTLVHEGRVNPSSTLTAYICTLFLYTIPVEIMGSSYSTHTVPPPPTVTPLVYPSFPWSKVAHVHYQNFHRICPPTWICYKNDVRHFALRSVFMIAVPGNLQDVWGWKGQWMLTSTLRWD